MLGELSFTDQDEPMLLCGIDIVGFNQESKSWSYSPVDESKLTQPLVISVKGSNTDM